MGKEGNTERTESIFRRYGATICGFINRHTPQSMDAEDLWHDVFYKFLISEQEGNLIEDVSAWLHRVTRNLIIDRSRKLTEQPMPHLKGKDDEVPISELLLDDRALDDELSGGQFNRALAEALAELPVEQRSIWEMHELQGIPFKELSEASGVPINTLISRKRYATQHLQRRLEGLYSEL